MSLQTGDRSGQKRNVPLELKGMALGSTFFNKTVSLNSSLSINSLMDSFFDEVHIPMIKSPISRADTWGPRFQHMSFQCTPVHRNRVSISFKQPYSTP